MWPETYSGRPPLRHSNVSSGSLRGLEKPVPPIGTDSVRSSISDINKPLPQTPQRQKNSSRSSSVYSEDIEELVDLYLSGAVVPHRLQSSSAKSLRKSIQDDEVYDLPLHDHTGNSISQPFLRGVQPLNLNRGHDGNITDYGPTSYHQSKSERSSPGIPPHLPLSIKQSREVNYSDPSKIYRETLLPFPFLSASHKTAAPYADSLQGQRLKNTYTLAEPNDIYPPSPSLPIDVMNLPSARRWITRNSLELVARVSKSSELKAHLQDCPWERPSAIIIDIPDDLGPYHDPFSYDNSPASSIESAPQMRPRPAPAPKHQRGHSNDYATAEHSAPVVRTSMTSSASPSESSSGYSTPPPENWTPLLKLSNPHVPRIPRAERSPAIGLSAYQNLGVKAWEEFDERDKRQRKGLFHRRKETLASLISEPTKVDIRSISISPKSRRPTISAPLQLNDLDSLPVDPRMSSTTSKSRLTTDEQPRSPHSRTKTNSSSFLAIASPFKASESRHSIQRADSERSSKTLSWMASRRSKAKQEKRDDWREEMKKKITVIGVQDSVGLSGNVPLLADVIEPSPESPFVSSEQHERSPTDYFYPVDGASTYCHSPPETARIHKGDAGVWF